MNSCHQIEYRGFTVTCVQGQYRIAGETKPYKSLSACKAEIDKRTANDSNVSTIFKRKTTQ